YIYSGAVSFDPTHGCVTHSHPYFAMAPAVVWVLCLASFTRLIRVL
ncbi:MAG: hypothetical protein ACJAVW_002612, partial [Spirosomataceae bacterium]